MCNDELKHYGVLGMKWGVRRSKEVRAAKAAHKSRKTKIDLEDRTYDAYKKMEGSLPFTKKRKEAAKLYEKEFVKTLDEYEKERARYKNELATAKAKAEKRITAEQAKKKADKALAKMEKQKYKEAVKQRANEIYAGESAVGKIWASVTDWHKYYAKATVRSEMRAKANKN